MQVFVYGTLMDAEQADAVLDDYDYGEDSVLTGLHRVDGTYPTLAPGGSVRGRLLETDDIAALDTYEGVDSGLYVRVTVPLADSESATAATAVETYVGDPDPLDAPAEWPGEGPFANRVRAYLDDHPVRVVPADRWDDEQDL